MRRETLKTQEAGLGQKVEASQEMASGLPKPEHFVELVREDLSTLDFGTKPMVPEMLDVKVGIDGHNVEVTVVIPIPDYAIATPQTG